MIYLVTYSKQNKEAGANLLGHIALLFSEFDENTQQLEVVDRWTFYGLPSTGNTKSCLTRLKISIGLDVDFYGNHGMLRREDMRFLDLGCGLHGVTFELTKENFELLKNNCITMAAEQERAIREVVDSQGIMGKSLEKTRIYPHEQFSPLIYALEKIKAEQQGRESRLKPFELRVSWSLTGPNLHHTSNCKSQALTLLATVLSKKQIDRLTEGGKHPTVPRFSGVLEPIFLHSMGPLLQHRKSSGEVVHYRNSTDPAVKLYWTLPPQELEALSTDTIKLFEVDKEYCPEVKAIVGKLQRLEWLLRNASIPAKYQRNQADLILRVIECYKTFSIIEPKEATEKVSGLTGYIFSLFSLPRDKEELRLQRKITQAKMLFNSLYMAIVDGWKINDSSSSCSSSSSSSSSGTTTEVSESKEEARSVVLDTPLEALASYLSTKDQKNLCSIIGRIYCEPELFLDEEEDVEEEEDIVSTSASIH